MVDNPPLSDAEIELDSDARRSRDINSEELVNAPTPPDNSRTHADETSEGLPGSANLTGRRLGEFRLLRHLGRGGMADVYLAEQTTLKRQVAVKVLRADFVSDDTYLRRFEQEATSAAGLNHPNIVQVYAIGEEQGIHYIAQEYVQGQNLRDFLVRQGPPSLSAALLIMQQVASALEAAGDAGIVHRDIKPENILITRKGVAKVADFGLAQLSQAGERVNLTQVGVTMGTPLYMSPEQINGRKLDPRTDIYSFGVTCYHMLVGRPPFRGETALAVAVQHLNEAAEPLAHLRSDLPKRLCDLVEKSMAKSPNDRFATAAELQKELDRIAKSLRTMTAGGDVNRREFDPAYKPLVNLNHLWRLGKYRHLLAYLVGCGVVAAVSAMIGWSMRPGDPLVESNDHASRVPKQLTAADQLYLATQLVNDEEHWRAVIEYFPKSVVERRWAEEKLALLYLNTDRLDEALEIFEKFSKLGDEDPRTSATGLAGKAIVGSFQGDYRGSQQVLAGELIPLEKHLSEDVARLVESCRARNREFLSEGSHSLPDTATNGPAARQDS